MSSKTFHVVLAQKLFPSILAFICYLITIVLLFNNFSEGSFVSLYFVGNVDGDASLISKSNNNNNQLLNKAQFFSRGLYGALIAFFIAALITNFINFCDFVYPLIINKNESNKHKAENEESLSSQALPLLRRYFSIPFTTKWKWVYLLNILVSGASAFCIFLSFVTMLSWSDRDHDFHASTTSQNIYGSIIAFWIMLMLSSVVQILSHWLHFTYDDVEQEKQESNFFDAKSFPLIYRPLRINNNIHKNKNNNRNDDDENDKEENFSRDGTPEVLQALHLLSISNDHGDDRNNNNTNCYSSNLWNLHRQIAIVVGFFAAIVHLICFCLLVVAWSEDRFYTNVVVVATLSSSTTPVLFVQRLTDGLLASILIFLFFASLTSIINLLEWLLLSNDANPTSNIDLIDTNLKKILQIYANRLVSGTHVFVTSVVFVLYNLADSAAGSRDNFTSSQLVTAFFVFLLFGCFLLFSISHYLVPGFLVGELTRELQIVAMNRKFEDDVTRALLSDDDDKNKKKKKDARNPQDIFDVCREVQERNEEEKLKSNENSKNQQEENKKKKPVDFLDPTFIPRRHVIDSSNFDDVVERRKQKKKQYFVTINSSRDVSSSSLPPAPSDYYYFMNTYNDQQQKGIPLFFEQAVDVAKTRKKKVEQNEPFFDNDDDDEDDDGEDEEIPITTKIVPVDEISLSKNKNSNDEKNSFMKYHIRMITRDLLDAAYIQPDLTRHWILLSKQMLVWRESSDFIFWTRFEDFTRMIRRCTHDERIPPRLLSNFHPFPVMFSSMPGQSASALSETSSFPSSTRLLGAVSFLTSSSDTIPLLFQIFSKSASSQRHLLPNSSSSQEQNKKNNLMKIGSGCYHTTFNYGGLWRHSFLDSFIPMQGQSNLSNHHHHENEDKNTNTCCSVFCSSSSSSNQEENNGENNNRNKEKKMKNENDFISAIRSRLLAPHCQLDYNDIYLPLIQKGLAKLAGSYCSAAVSDACSYQENSSSSSSSSSSNGSDGLNILHDLCGLPMERFSWPNYYKCVEDSNSKNNQNKRAKKSSSNSPEVETMSEFEEINQQALLTSAFVEIDHALMRYEEKIVDAMEQPIVVLSLRKADYDDDGSVLQQQQLMRIFACATVFVEKERAVAFEDEIEFHNECRIRQRRNELDELEKAKREERERQELENEINPLYKEEIIDDEYKQNDDHKNHNNLDVDDKNAVPTIIVGENNNERNNNGKLHQKRKERPDDYFSDPFSESFKQEQKYKYGKNYYYSDDHGEQKKSLPAAVKPQLTTSSFESCDLAAPSPLSVAETATAQNYRPINNDDSASRSLFFEPSDQQNNHHTNNNSNHTNNNNSSSSCPASPNLISQTNNFAGINVEDFLQQQPSIVVVAETPQEQQQQQNLTKESNQNDDDDQSSLAIASDTTIGVANNKSSSIAWSGHTLSPKGRKRHPHHHQTNVTDTNNNKKSSNKKKKHIKRKNENDDHDDTTEKPSASSNNTNDDDVLEDDQLSSSSSSSSSDEEENDATENVTETFNTLGDRLRSEIKEFLTALPDEEQNKREAGRVMRFVLVSVDHHDEQQQIFTKEEEKEIEELFSSIEGICQQLRVSLIKSQLSQLLKIVDTRLMPKMELVKLLIKLYDQPAVDENSNTATKIDPCGHLIPLQQPLPIQFLMTSSSTTKRNKELYYEKILASRPDLRSLLTEKIKRHFFRNGLLASDDFSCISLSDAIILSKMKWMEWSIDNNKSSSSVFSVDLAKTFSGLGCLHLPIGGLLKDFSQIHPATNNHSSNNNKNIITARLENEQVSFLQDQKEKLVFGLSFFLHYYGTRDSQKPRNERKKPSMYAAELLNTDLFETMEEQQKFLEAPTFAGMVHQTPKMATSTVVDYNTQQQQQEYSSSSQLPSPIGDIYFFSRPVTDIRVPNRFSSSSSSSDWILKINVEKIGKTSIFVGLHHQDGRKDLTELLNFGRGLLPLQQHQQQESSPSKTTSPSSSCYLHHHFESDNNIPVCGCQYHPLMISVFKVVIPSNIHNEKTEEENENKISSSHKTMISPIRQSNTNQFSTDRDLYLRVDLEKTFEDGEDSDVYYLIVPRIQNVHEHLYVRNYRPRPAMKTTTTNQQQEQQEKQQKSNSSAISPALKEYREYNNKRRQHQQQMMTNNSSNKKKNTGTNNNNKNSSQQQQNADNNQDKAFTINRSHKSSSHQHFSKIWLEPFVEVFETPSFKTTRKIYSVLQTVNDDDDRDEKKNENKKENASSTRILPKLLHKEQVFLTTESKRADFVFSLSVPKTSGIRIEGLPVNYQTMDEILDEQRRNENIKLLLKDIRQNGAGGIKNNNSDRNEDENADDYESTKIPSSTSKHKKLWNEYLPTAADVLHDDSNNDNFYYRPANSHRSFYASLLRPSSQLQKIISETQKSNNEKTSILNLCEKSFWRGRKEQRQREKKSSSSSAGINFVLPTHQQINTIMHQARFLTSNLEIPFDILRNLVLGIDDDENENDQGAAAATATTTSYNNIIIRDMGKFVKENYCSGTNSDEGHSIRHNHHHYFVSDLARDTPGAIVLEKKSDETKQDQQEQGKIPFVQIDGETKLY